MICFDLLNHHQGGLRLFHLANGLVPSNSIDRSHESYLGSLMNWDFFILFHN